MHQTLAGMQRKDWDRRVGESTEGEPDTCLSALDDFHAHGKAAPSTGELDRAISDAIQRAADAGASRSFVKKLTSFLTVKYRDSFRLQLGADAPARVKPLKLKFDESSFPKNVHPRRYSPPQQRFLEKAVPEMERVGILKRSTTRFVAPPYLPVKKGEGPGAYRFCVDSRIQNRCTEAHSYAIPIINELLSSLLGGKIFASFDLVRGFYQFPLHKDSQKYAGVITHSGTWSFTRCIMGMLNSCGYFVDVMRGVLDGTSDPTVGPPDNPEKKPEVNEKDPEVIKRRINLFNKRLVSYVDEQLAAGAGDTLSIAENDLLETIDIYLHRCKVFNIRLKITKCNFWMRSLEWCGHKVSERGVSIAPSRLEALNKIPVPITGGELMQYVCALNFLRNKIPFFSALVAPLRGKLNACLDKCKRRTKNDADRIKLADVGWTRKDTSVFEKTKQALRDAVTLVRYDDRTHTLCLLADASSDHFGSVLTQIKDCEVNLPFNEQNHEPIEILSGSFKPDTAPARWAINSKELYAIIHAVKRLRYYLARPKAWLLYTDHRNLVYLLAPSIARVRVSQASMDRLIRWSWELIGMNYRIIHIPGERRGQLRS